MLTDTYAKDAEAWRKEHALVPQSEVQSFFDGLAAEIQKPTVGDKFKDSVRAILLRAEECGLYKVQR